MGMESKANKVFFADRANFDTTFKRPDILLSHQWQCELNYLYNEALYRGVPLVHNSPPYKEVGYYYPDFDVKIGMQKVFEAIKGDEAQVEKRRKNKKFLNRFSITNPEVGKTYQELIRDVMKTPIRE